MKKKVSKKRVMRAEVAPKREFPAHLNTTPEEWRALKRTEWREVRQALDRFYHGCGTPETRLWMGANCMEFCNRHLVGAR